MIVTHSTRNLSRSYKIFIIIFAMLTIFQCNSVYDSNIFGELLINGSWQIILFILSIYSLNQLFSKRINITYLNKIFMFLFCYIFVVVLLLIFYYIYSPFTLFYVILFLIDPIMLVIFLVGSINTYSKRIGKYFFETLEDIVIVLAIISLFFWALELNGIAPNMSTMIKWGGQPRAIPGYYFIQFLPQNSVSFLGKSLMRNTGAFVEPSMFSYVLDISLLIELFIRRHISKFRVILLFVAIFSTTSTAGFIVASLAIFYYIFMSMKSVYKYIIILFVPVIFIIEKSIWVSKEDATGSSYDEHALEWHVDVIDWYRHIFIGNGLPSIGRGGSNQASFAVGLSSGLMAVLAYGGIILLLFYLLPTLCSSFVSKQIFGLSILSFLLFILIMVVNCYLYVVILSYLWVSFILKNYIKNNEEHIIN